MAGAGKRAPRACEKCTRTKKKCDKMMPHCSRCSRLDVPCCYNFSYSVPTLATDLANSNFLTLQPVCFKNAYVAPWSHRQQAVGLAESAFPVASPTEPSAPRPDEISAAQVMSLLTSRGLLWRDVADRFFATAQQWMGVVQLGWFRARTLCMESGTVELVLLLVSMHLVTVAPSPDAADAAEMLADPLYRCAKKLLVLVRALALPSVELVQATALMAHYEFGHGDTLRAYMTLSDAVSMARVLSIQPPRYSDPVEREGSPRALEQEQHCLLFWSLYMFDKTLHLDQDYLDAPVQVPLPPGDALLPCQNRIWDATADQYISVQLRVPLVAALALEDSAQLGVFQRSLQACTLIHRTLLWLESVRSCPSPSCCPPSSAPTVTEAFTALEMQTRRLIELIIIHPDVFDEAGESLAMCFFLLLLLHSTVLTGSVPSGMGYPPSAADMDMLKARAGINLAIRMVADSAHALSERLAAYPELVSVMSPAPVFASFLALRKLSALEGGVDEADARFHNIYSSMFSVARRWAVAGRFAGAIDGWVDIQYDASSRHTSPISLTASDSSGSSLPVMSPPPIKS